MGYLGYPTGVRVRRAAATGEERITFRENKLLVDQPIPHSKTRRDATQRDAFRFRVFQCAMDERATYNAI